MNHVSFKAQSFIEGKIKTIQDGTAFYSQKSSSERTRDAIVDGVRCKISFNVLWNFMAYFSDFSRSGLDNAGKTTIVKKFNGEDIDIISPTVIWFFSEYLSIQRHAYVLWFHFQLGFNIKTMEYRKYAMILCLCCAQWIMLWICTVTNLIYGMSVDKKLSDHIGETTLKQPTVLYGWCVKISFILYKLPPSSTTSILNVFFRSSGW